MTRTLTHLQAPGNTEGGYTVDVGATELDEVLEQNTPSEKGQERQSKSTRGSSLPCDSPLLQRNYSSSDVMVRNLGLIQGNTRRSQTDGNSGNNSTGNKHSTVLRGTLEDRTDDPNPGRGHDSEPPSQNVCQLGDQESSKEGTRRHGCNDGTLSVRSWMAERPFVCIVLEERRIVSGGGVR